jgi:DNA methyltransferase 1-associated protein 1
MGTQKPKPKYKPKNEVLRKPEGMARELFNLLVNDSKDAAPLFPTDTGNNFVRNFCASSKGKKYLYAKDFINISNQVKDTSKQKLI